MFETLASQHLFKSRTVGQRLMIHMYEYASTVFFHTVGLRWALFSLEQIQFGKQTSLNSPGW